MSGDNVMTVFQRWLLYHGACQPAREWVGEMSHQEALALCREENREDWVDWMENRGALEELPPIPRHVLRVDGRHEDCGAFVRVPGGELLHYGAIAPFEIMKTTVTRGQWETLMGPASPLPQPVSYGPESMLPVTRVNWYDAVAFANRLGDGWRLPTEAEWEWAARGGEEFIFSGSDDPDMVGWHDNNSDRCLHPVAQLRPNGWGLYDMSGNVWEWTATLEGSYRVYRGGSWYYEPVCSRVAFRDYGAPSLRDYDLGFRLVRSVK